jgi:hypothetical protein
MSTQTPQIAFVSAPGGSMFMQEILVAVAAAVAEVGGRARCHTGVAEDVLDPSTVCVVVPHEYFALTGGRPNPDLLDRFISFGVERPGTATFATALRYAGPLAARFEISGDSVAQMRHRGLSCERFVLGYVRSWDHWQRRSVERSIDLTYLGTADERRLAILATIADELAGLSTELLIPPHEQMTRPRPDFVAGVEKWRLLARSRLMLNLHREDSTAFEWVRCLEAMINGCAVITEPSGDLGDLVPGEHVLVGTRGRLGPTISAALRYPDSLSAIASRAYEFVRECLDMRGSAARLVAVAAEVLADARWPGLRRRPSIPVIEPTGMASWLPVAEKGPILAGSTQRLSPSSTAEAGQRGNRGSLLPAGRRPAHDALVDVVCVHRPGDGPVERTLRSLAASRSAQASVHLTSASRAICDHPLGAPGEATGARQLDPSISRGAGRNCLLADGVAPYVLAVDPGDEVLGDCLSALVDVLDREPETTIVYPIAVLGSEMVVNVLVPEPARLERFAYLGRGFLVRRSWLEHIGGFADLDAGLDHEFWVRTCRLGGRAVMLRRIGIRVWPR